MVCFQWPIYTLLNFQEVYSLMPLNSLWSYLDSPIITKSQSLYIFRKLLPLQVVCVHFRQYSLKLSMTISLFSLISRMQVLSFPRQKGAVFICGMTVSLNARKVVMESCRISSYFSFRQPSISCSSRSLLTLFRQCSILTKCGVSSSSQKLLSSNFRRMKLEGMQCSLLQPTILPLKPSEIPSITHYITLDKKYKFYDASAHHTCNSIREQQLSIKYRRMTTLSAQPFTPNWPLPAQAQPNSLEVHSAEVKQQAEARPQAIYLNINPTLLPVLVQIVKQFCNKYLDSTSPETIDGILRKIAKVQLTITRLVGIRELVAAVVYCQYSDRIRLKLKDYSSLNQLHQRIFNKKYVAYQTLLKRQASYAKEQKLEEDEKEEEDRDSSEERPLNRGLAISSRKQAIELIYDGIFQTPYLQLNRREVIQKMAERCEEIDEKVFEAMTWTTSHTLKLYYAIFAYLKTLGMNVGFTKYREAVYNFAGYTLKRELTYLVQRLMKAVSRERTDHSGQESSDSHSNQPQ